MAIDNATALARLQGYRELGRQMGLIKPVTPQPQPQPRSVAEAIYPRLPRDGDQVKLTANDGTQSKGLR
jgi:hypothetical protein